jgi:type VI protein secretion system component VasK
MKIRKRALTFEDVLLVSAMLLLLLSTMLMSLETNTGTVETVKEQRSQIKKPPLSRFQQRLKDEL